jgi:hypothetical protein
MFTILYCSFDGLIDKECESYNTWNEAAETLLKLESLPTKSSGGRFFIIPPSF